MSPNRFADWNRVLRDVRPSAIMRTVEQRKVAVHAAWLARVVDDQALAGYAGAWHAAGWRPTEWWQLACALKLVAAETADEAPAESATSAPGGEGEQPHLRRELQLELWPADWAEWRTLAASHGPLVATRALRDPSGVPLSARLHWASADEKLTRLGFGRPGDPLSP